MTAQSPRYPIAAVTDRLAYLLPDRTAQLRGQPQRLFLQLDPGDGRMSLLTRHQSDDGTTPIAVWHGTLQWVALTTTTDPVALTTAINAGELDPIIARVVAGYTRSWDGRSHIGDYTDDARAALDELAEWLTNAEPLAGEMAGLWDAADWLLSNGRRATLIRDFGIRPDTPDDELRAMAEQIDEIARAENVALDGTYEELAGWRDAYDELIGTEQA